MTPERWQQVKELFQSVLERAPDERAAFLGEACAADAELRREVESLLAADEQAEGFIENPAYEADDELLPEEADEPMVGRRLGPYRVLREIGRGGMGAVYLAERADDQFRKRVAIKLVKRGMDTDAIRRRFRSEQQILANLEHPNIARLIDGGTTGDGLSYFIMEYVEGLPIDRYGDAHKLSTEARLELFRTVCSAVQYAHQHHVIHRDIKASNILVTSEGVPKLLDFGIAKLLDPGRSSPGAESTAAVLRPMTPEYASPEQVRGETVGPTSDIYSLGVLLYELLTGHHPYRLRGRTPQEIERVICGEEPEKPSAAIDRIEETAGAGGGSRITPESVSATREGSPERLRSRLAGDLDTVALMALRKEPERRYASVEQFSEDLRRHLVGLPVRARKDTFGYRSAKFLKRNKPGVLTWALAALVLLAVLGVEFYRAAGGGENKTVDSIAVLPFANMGGDPNVEYLSDGITESLINSLSQLPALKVIARTTVFRYKGQEVDPQKIGRELKVRAVLTGRVAQQGEALSVQADLVDVTNGSQLWGERYHQKRADPMALPETIAKQISEKLRLRLTGVAQKQLTKRYTDNAEAYHLYLKGRYYWNKRNGEAIRKGIEYFRQAIEKDPGYALAYVGLADSYAVPSSGLAPKDRMPKAKAAVLRALTLDDQLAEAHASLGVIKYRFDRDWSGAEAEFQRALELNRNYETAHEWYGVYLGQIGQFDQGLMELRRAQELDPLSPVIMVNTGMIFYSAHQYDETIMQCRQALELDPDFVLAHMYLGRAYEQKGMYPEAVEEYLKVRALQKSSPEAIAALRAAYTAAGWRGYLYTALALAQEQAQKRPGTAFSFAALYARLGEKDQALKWLEQAEADRDDLIVSLKVDPRFDGLRSDPRFTSLLRRVGFAP